MVEPSNTPMRRRGRGIRPWLIQLKCIGLMSFLGGLASLTAMGFLGPSPSDAAGWRLLRDVMRAVFWPCVFWGLMLTVAAGVALWLQHPRVFLRTRWFRLKLVLLLAILPSLHFFARGRVTAFYEAVEAGRLETLPSLHADVTWAFFGALLVMLCVASIGRFKPRLGERIGERARRG